MNSICQDCGKTFTDKHNLAVQRENHAKNEVKRHILRKFSLEGKKFQNHIKLHQHFECVNCGESIKMSGISQPFIACKWKWKGGKTSWASVFDWGQQIKFFMKQYVREFLFLVPQYDVCIQ